MRSAESNRGGKANKALKRAKRAGLSVEGNPHREQRAKRWKFGQNFLVDPEVIRQIAEDVPTVSGDWVVEIGPGQGAITKQLASRCAKLTVLEIDPKWVEHIGNHPEWGNIEVVRTDATRLDVEDLLSRYAPYPGAKPVVVGNLPYNRAAPILFRFLPHIARFKSMHVMVQYEVGKRLCAKPHSRDFGFLSVFAQNLATAELQRKIGPDAFRPRPKVLSATVKFQALDKPFASDPVFIGFAELCFTQKRKKLSNALVPAYPKGKVLEALQSIGVEETARAEDLSVGDFVKAFALLGPPPGMKARQSLSGMDSGLPVDEAAWTGDDEAEAD